MVMRMHCLGNDGQAVHAACRRRGHGVGVGQQQATIEYRLTLGVQNGPIGHAHASRRSLKKTDINPEEDASTTSIRRRPKTKKKHVQTG